MLNLNNMVVFLRIIIGIVLLASGFEKLLSPYQNFLYVLQAYEFFPTWLEKIVAISVPWVELMVGLFMLLGLWTQWALKGALLLFAGFIFIVGQALLRHLPMDQCGCFGESIHILPQHIILFDSFTLLSIIWLISQPIKVKAFSLDRYFQ
ncbi:MAG: DoxX family membrane protein [Candidatus Omnitrophica bacterium]|nr:DoxX family membrane protein [Candidatus Omnitrophota bacterium]